jgi:hypothetical protein
MALALLALPAGASATGGIEADKYPASLTGASLFGSHVFIFDDIGAKYTCPINLSAELSGPAASFSASTSWGGDCKNLSSNGCKLEFRPGTQNSFDIGPPGCGPIKGTVGPCTVSIASQTGLPATFTNVGEGSKAKLMIDAAAKFKYTHSGVGCGPGEIADDATIDGEWEVIGRDLSGSVTPIRATDSFGGLFISGEAEPLFKAEKYPFPLVGNHSIGADTEFGFPQLGKVSTICGVIQLTQQLSAATSALAPDAKYESCKTVENGTAYGTTTVNTNGCDHVFGVDKSVGSYYIGSLELACPGKALEIIWDPPTIGICTISIPSQFLSGTEYAITGTGANRQVLSLIEGGEGIEYTLTEKGFGCYGTVGTYKNGTLAESYVSMHGA